MIHQFADLKADELLALPAELTVFLFSLGGLEQHGAHLPMGTRTVIAERATIQLAKILQEKMPQWNFVLMPALPLTVDAHTSKISFPVRAHVVRDVLVDQCVALKRLKFSKFAVYTSHLTPRQLSAIEDAGRIVSQRKWGIWGEKSQFISIASQEVNSKEVMKSPMIPNPKEHAGAMDTGLMLAFQADQVAKNYVSLPTQPQQNQNALRLISYFKHEVDGYWGKPAEANAEVAKAQFKENLTKTAQMLQTVFETGQGQSLFQSGYRYFFFNGSFFKAYFAATLFFVLMIFWTLWSLKDVFEP